MEHLSSFAACHRNINLLIIISFYWHQLCGNGSAETTAVTNNTPTESEWSKGSWLVALQSNGCDQSLSLILTMHINIFYAKCTENHTFSLTMMTSKWHSSSFLACNSRLRSAIRRHHPPQRAVLIQICCFGEHKMVMFQILLDGAEPCDAGTTQLSSPVCRSGGQQDPLGICVVVHAHNMPK